MQTCSGLGMSIESSMIKDTAASCVPSEFLNGTVIGNDHNLKRFSDVEDPSACCGRCGAEPLCGAWSFHCDGDKPCVCWIHPLHATDRSPNPQAVSGFGHNHSTSKPGPKMACQRGSAGADLPFCDSAQPISVRVADLVSRINDTDKPDLLTARASKAIPELGVPGYYWGTNCIQSVENGAHGETPARCTDDWRCSTKFPNPPNMMSTFNRTAMKWIGATMAIELRALYNLGLANGLDCWGPVINLARDPRWGRNGEAGSEDPYLMSAFGLAYTLGFQNGTNDASQLTTSSSRFFQGLVTLKHWDANTLEDSDGYTRHTFDSNISNFVLQDSYLPAFRAAVVEGGARGIM
jgi:beta-D-xylosidase 4